MNTTFLKRILEVKRRSVESAKSRADIGQLRELAAASRSGYQVRRLSAALSRTDRVNIIAEFKRASPSKGDININIDVAEAARAYQNGGACAISVLTEEQFFKGSLDDLRNVREVAELPILRKDFIIDEFQIYESAAAGADAILLIVAALTGENLEAFHKTAIGLGLDALVEVHDLEELKFAQSIGATLIGVNNRNLHTFKVSLDVSRELITNKTDGCTMISESGLSSSDEIMELKNLGFDGFLIGETLMRSGNAETELRMLATERTEFTETEFAS